MAEPNWASLSDEEIAAMDAPPSAEPPANENDDASLDPEASEPTAELEGEGTDEDVTGGADDSDNPELEGEETDGDLEPEAEDSATQDPFDGADPEPAEDDQSTEEQEPEAADEDSEPDDGGFKAKYEELMAPFKASGREVKLDDPSQARRLMQMGVDYNNKMQVLKPHLRLIRTLEKADLLDQDRVNFLIDLSLQKPEAIKKLLSDSSIDPMDLDLEDGAGDYSPADHSVSEQEMGVREAFEALSGAPTFNRTVDVLTKEWDSKSKATLAEQPSLIGIMHNHIANGTYDEVWGEVVKRRMLGDLMGLSDLDAYNATGQAMADAGTLSDLQGRPQQSSPSRKTTQASAQGNGSPKKRSNNAAQKRAASPTKGGASGGGKSKVPNLATMSDEEILNLDPSILSKL